MHKQIQIKAIELLQVSFQTPETSVPLENIDFNINVESRSDVNQKILAVIIKVEIKSPEYQTIFATFSVSCIYEIDNFEALVRVTREGVLSVDPLLAEILHQTSISTTRGIIFEHLKGSFLHSFLLPVIDVRQFQMN